ncbi:hypothetical protein FOL47_009706 [Perkinsus chesapeaki]|uniref:Uncharacterized protein n=1 Tax=Perkinsus chesapeaki TaxID=330153 RepID=A0A7J6L6P9_PERCH|nr:hypothetical protein FOL47_009706 [Perkinsus chesapeaki]
MVTAIPMVIKLVLVVLLLGVHGRPIPAKRLTPNYFHDITRQSGCPLGPYCILTANATRVESPAVSSVLIFREAAKLSAPYLLFYFTTFYNEKDEIISTTAYAAGQITLHEVYKSKVGGLDYNVALSLNLPDPPGKPNGTNFFFYPMMWSVSAWREYSTHIFFYNGTWFQDDSRVGLMLEANPSIQDHGHNFSYYVAWYIETGPWPPDGGADHLFYAALTFRVTMDGIEQANVHRTFISAIF